MFFIDFTLLIKIFTLDRITKSFNRNEYKFLVASVKIEKSNNFLK